MRSPLPWASAQAGPETDPAVLQGQAWRLFLQGSRESRQQALDRLEQAAALLSHAGNLADLAKLREMQGVIFFSQSRYREAIRAESDGLELYRRLGRPEDETRLRYSLALNWFNLADDGQARRLLRQVAAESRSRGNTRLLSMALELEAQLEARAGRPNAAIALLEQAFSLTGSRGDRAHQVEILDAMGIVLLPLGQLSEVRSLLQRRRALAPDQTSPLELVLRTLESRSRPEDLQSPAQLENNIRRFRGSGDRTNLAASLEQLAIVRSNRGDAAAALALQKEALALYEQQGMTARAGATLLNIAQSQAYLGDYGTSLRDAGRALELARRSGALPLQTSALLDLGDLQASLGSHDLALSSYRAALALAERQQDRFRQVRALTGVADMERKRRQPLQALASAERALTLTQGEAMPLQQSSALATLVRVQESLGDLAAAQASAERIRAIGASSGDALTRAFGDVMAARVRLAKGQPAAAAEGLNRAIAVFRAQRQSGSVAAGLDLLGRAQVALNRPADALRTYGEEEQLCEAMGDRRCLADVLYQQSRLQAGLGQTEPALTLIERSLAITEGLRSTLSAADLRQSYFAMVQDHYDWCIELLLRLKIQQPNRDHDRRALAVSERARARGLVELLSAARADVTSGADPSLLRQRRQLDERIRELLAGRLRLSQRSTTDPALPNRLADLENRLARLQAQQLQLEETLRRSSPRYADLLLPQSLDATAIQALLDDDTLLLQVHLTDQQGRLWLIDRKGVDSHPLPGRAELERLVTALHADIGKNRENSQAALSLSRILLQPVAARLPGKRLVIVPHGVLVYVPFAALPDHNGGQPLVVNHELITLPSATTLAVLRRAASQRRSGPPSLLLFADPVFGKGDPRLPQALPASRPAAPGTTADDDGDDDWTRLSGTAREAAAISGLLKNRGPQPRLQEGLKASRQNLLAMNLNPYRLLHIATHGQADGLHPERSRLVFSLFGPDGRPLDGNLRLGDIYNLQMGTDLVVLSACQSGLGALVRGEGLVGLTRGFLHAGSRRVMASLWNVDDDSTAELMTVFYRGLLTQGLSPAAALRQAQITLMNQPRWRSPKHWAAFTLQGDWR